MQDQMFPDSKPATTAKKEGFQSGTTEEMRGDRKIKATKISFKDMAARAKAGMDTSIKAI